MTPGPQISISQGIGQHLAQSQRLLPSQLQGLDLLQCSALDLQQRITKELLQNPVLVQNQNPDMVIDDERLFPSENDSASERQEREFAEDGQAYREAVAARSTEEGALTERGGQDSDSEEKRAYLFECYTGETGLYSNLVKQLSENVSVDNPQLLALCRNLCEYVDEKGFLLTPDERLCSELKCTERELHQAVDVLQQLWPVGIGARSPQQCLLLQLKDRGVSPNALSWRILTECESALENNDLRQMAEHLGVEEDDVRAALMQLKSLDPCPGFLLDTTIAPTVLPDVFFERDSHGRWTVRLNSSIVPDLTLDEFYVSMRNDSRTAANTRNYLQDKIDSANRLITGIANRNETLLRVSGVIAEKQSVFLDSGNRMDLKPLTRGDIAQLLDMAESTVGRALDNKFAHAPWGTVQFDDLFVRRAKSLAGDADVTTEQIRHRICELIAAEDKHKPLSDQFISDQLKAEGHVVERRTVAKYRDLEKIPSTSERRLRE